MQITKACEKVLSLDVNSPLMKVLAGLEYILKKSQVISAIPCMPWLYGCGYTHVWQSQVENKH